MVDDHALPDPGQRLDVVDQGLEGDPPAAELEVVAAPADDHQGAVLGAAAEVAGRQRDGERGRAVPVAGAGVQQAERGRRRGDEHLADPGVVGVAQGDLDAGARHPDGYRLRVVVVELLDVAPVELRERRLGLAVQVDGLGAGRDGGPLLHHPPAEDLAGEEDQPQAGQCARPEPRFLGQPGRDGRDEEGHRRVAVGEVVGQGRQVELRVDGRQRQHAASAEHAEQFPQRGVEVHPGDGGAPVRLGEPELLAEPVEEEVQAAAAADDGLRFPGRAGGGDHIAGVRVLEPPGPPCGVRGGFEEDRAGGGVEDDLGHSRARPPVLVGRGGVVADHRGGAAALFEPAVLLRGQSGVHRYGHRAGPPGGLQPDQVGGRQRAHHQDARPGHAGRGEPFGQGGDGGLQLRVRHRPAAPLDGDPRGPFAPGGRTSKAGGFHGRHTASTPSPWRARLTAS